MRQKASA